jgi:PAS domain S-box-containing protein
MKPLLRVLVVEDSEDDNSLLIRELKKGGYEVVSQRVETSEAMAEGLAAQEWDLVISDYSMPQFGGLAALSQLHESGLDLPFILMSGTIGEEVAVEALKAGAHDYLMKDNLSKLIPTVQRELRDAKTRLEHTQAGQALRESEERYRLLFESNPLPMWVYDLETLRFLAVNDAAIEHYGFSLDEFLEMTIKDIRPLDELGRLDISLRQLQVQERSGPWKHRTRDGTLIEVEIISHDIKYSGRPARLVLANDISDRVTAEAAVLQSELKFRSLFAAMEDAIFVLDQEGRFIEIAPTNPINLYRPSADMLGKTVTELFAPEQARFFLELIQQTLKTRQVMTAEYSLKIEAEMVWFSASASPLSPDSVIWVAHNITGRIQNENKIHRQLEHLTALSEIDHIISSNFDLRITMANLLGHVCSQLGVDAADLLLFNSTSQSLEYAAGVGFRTNATEKVRQRLGEGYAGAAALERQMVHIPDLAADNENFRRRELVVDEAFISYWAIPLIAKGEVKGVLEVLHRARLEPNNEWLEFLNSLAGQAAIAIDNSTLFDNLQRSNTDLALAYDATIEGWSHALDLRDKETEGHTQRVTDLTIRLARIFGLSEMELVQVRWGALLHDIGKMGVPDGILLKAAPLTEEEWVAMKKHPAFAYELLSPIRYLRNALDIPYCHHEKWDGSGYPRALKGKQIPLTARIFAVVDVWDALTSDRPYRPAWTKERTLEHIRSLSGTHFDPRAVEVILAAGVLDIEAAE